ncbi:MAG: formylglycine-generating enzyme family protein [Myxococcota bacterium]
MKSVLLQILFIGLTLAFLSSCFVKEKCYSNEDCSDGKICNMNNGECYYECKNDSDCPSNFICQKYRCIPSSQQSLICPPDMANIENSFCMDRYEASRPDATESSAGTNNSYATSRRGVIPWQIKDNLEANNACKNAGKRLCTEKEWYFACAGKDERIYSYGNKYDPIICNGIDAFCECNSSECSSLSHCPYPHCYSEKSSEGGGPCGAAFRVMPTGSFDNCVNEYGVYDLNGNVWELVDTEDGYEHFRGGAYNCGDSESLHRCDYDATWGPSAKGFRCCKDK